MHALRLMQASSLLNLLLDLLENPQNRYHIVHIAGTKGKGTTSTATALLLQARGFRVGLYTSPHLLRLEERIHCIGRDCSASELVGLVNRMREVSEKLESEARWAASTSTAQS